jgi:uncharacterized protein
VIKRTLEKSIQKLAKKFPVIVITGPRQSGKTTLVKSLFKNKPYVSLENPDDLELALTDPRRFLAQFTEGAVLDEVQRAPELFSYIQGIVDQSKKKGQFVLTGSQNFLLMESITQTLAGRVALFTLLPFSISELNKTKYEPKTIEKSLFYGFYPRIYDDQLLPKEWLPNYIQTYIERDVRQIKDVHDLPTFQRFLKLCAARTGQILNINNIAVDCGISPNTAKSWLNVLESSYITFTLQPHYKNFNKRLIKSPKLYFWDTGLVCYLLGIQKQQDLLIHPARGALFETWVISEFHKQFYNQGERPPLYYWRDKQHEVDLILERSTKLIPLEIKSSTTIQKSLFEALKYWCKLASFKTSKSYLIYAGEKEQDYELAQIKSWKSLPDLTQIQG